MTGDDEALWARAVRGDGEAFGVVFDRHRDRVRRHVTGLVAVPADADDVLAVVFLEAWRKRDVIRFVDGSILPWLLRTATYTSSNLARASRRYRQALQRLPPPDNPVADRVDEPHPVMAVLNTMSVTDQEVITLCVLEELSAEDAARVLGVRAGTVRTRLTRAKARLRQRFDPHTRELRTEEATNVQ
ncbi:RNA polymerase sigma factor [Microbacterium sp. ASV49]|uniref:RNA polymerase sigma factor n=1 Tax=Microbacterium candidum TaxID=3041922 RepID=A0ABT7N1Y8_9MICO|nr:RNA polymerase sigma factor [Microbacterium sp. ASV49]MDL9980729.1 RNA polymerase sigma factor [Microbacterium sp. ASV49]